MEEKKLQGYKERKRIEDLKEFYAKHFSKENVTPEEEEINRIFHNAVANSVYEGDKPEADDLEMLYKFAKDEITGEEYRNFVFKKLDIKKPE